jgi:hypothetical protein
LGRSAVSETEAATLSVTLARSPRHG